MLRPGFQIIILLITITLRNVYSEELERVTDDDLLDILRHEKYVVVLFSEYLSKLLIFICILNSSIFFS